MVLTDDDVSFRDIPTHRLITDEIFIQEIDTNYYSAIEKPHRHNFFEILWFTKEGGEHIVDFVSYPIEKNKVFFLAPETVHSLNTYQKEGILIILSKEFLSKLPYFAEDCFIALFNNFSSPFSFIMNSKEAETGKLLVKLFFDEYNQNPKNTNLLGSYCHSFLLFFKQIMEKQNNFIPLDQQSRIGRLYIEIEQFYKTEKKVNFYARKLNLSIKYLNDLAKNTLGITVSKLIRNRIILEAKRELRLDEYSIHRIAYNLGYNDPAYFSRFFKKEMGISPKVYQEINK